VHVVLPRVNTHAAQSRNFTWTIALNRTVIYGPALIATLLLTAAFASGSAAAEEPPGAVTGTVSFEENPTNKWRYSRYYVKRGAGKQLAETVVALEGVKAQRKRAPATVTVDQENFRFIPETTSVTAGDVVQFKNSDNVVHNVNCFHRDFRFNVNMPAGGMDKKTFAKAGGVASPYRLGCIFHSAMQAWVFVFDHPHHQVTTAGGEFKFAGIPPGEYTLEFVHPAGRMKASKRVVVKSGETQKVDIRLKRSDKAKP